MSGVVGTHVDAQGSVTPAGVTGPAILYGWQGRGIDGVNALLARVREGSVTGDIKGYVTAAAGASVPVEPAWFGDLGVRCVGGIFLEVVTGDLELVVYWK